MLLVYYGLLLLVDPLPINTNMRFLIFNRRTLLLYVACVQGSSIYGQDSTLRNEYTIPKLSAHRGSTNTKIDSSDPIHVINSNTGVRGVAETSSPTVATSTGETRTRKQIVLLRLNRAAIFIVGWVLALIFFMPNGMSVGAGDTAFQQATGCMGMIACLLFALGACVGVVNGNRTSLLPGVIAEIFMCIMLSARSWICCSSTTNKSSDLEMPHPHE